MEADPPVKPEDDRRRVSVSAGTSPYALRGTECQPRRLARSGRRAGILIATRPSDGRAVIGDGVGLVMGWKTVALVMAATHVGWVGKPREKSTRRLNAG